MQHIKPLSHQVLGVLSKTFSLWIHSIWSSRAAPRDKQTILHCLKPLFNRELIQTANSPAERKEIKLNPPNLYPGTDSFIFESLAVSHANKKLLKGRINTEQGVCMFRFRVSELSDRGCGNPSAAVFTELLLVMLYISVHAVSLCQICVQ